MRRVSTYAVFLLAGAILFGGGILVGQRTAAPKKTLLHAFAFQAKPGVTQAQLDELWSATQKMASAIPEIRNVWMGKVLNRGTEFQYGIVMEFDNNDALKKIYDPHAAHKTWVETYSKIRVDGTNTLDIQGQ